MTVHTPVASITAPYYASVAQESDFAQVARLWREFKLLRGDECHPAGAVDLSTEIAALPFPYLQPGNFILLARKAKGSPVGCVSLKRFDNAVGEVRRMYVEEAERGHGLGRMLMLELLMRAKGLGYKKIYLDSLKKFTHAHAIYETLGFSYIPAYDPAATEEMRENMIFMEKRL